MKHGDPKAMSASSAKKRRSLAVPISRRRFVLGLFFGLLPIRLRFARGMGRKEYPQGFREIKGEVRVNDRPVVEGDPVAFGDTVSTGPDGYAVFVVGRDAFMLQENARMEITKGPDKTAKKKGVVVLRVAAGRVLSVFGDGSKRFITNTAVVGIRGTAVYVEIEARRTYVCPCYGTTVVASRHTGKQEQLRTRHHEEPRYIYDTASGGRIEPGPVKNHTDEELIHIESLVGRIPPFVEDEEEFGSY